MSHFGSSEFFNKKFIVRYEELWLDMKNYGVTY